MLTQISNWLSRAIAPSPSQLDACKRGFPGYEDAINSRPCANPHDRDYRIGWFSGVCDRLNNLRHDIKSEFPDGIPLDCHQNLESHKEQLTLYKTLYLMAKGDPIESRLVRDAFNEMLAIIQLFEPSFTAKIT